MTKIQIICENSAAHRSGKQRVLAFCHLRKRSQGTKITVEFHYPGKKKRAVSRQPSVVHSLEQLRARTSLPEDATSYAVLCVDEDLPVEERNLRAGEAELFVVVDGDNNSAGEGVGRSISGLLSGAVNRMIQVQGEVSRFSFQCPECRKANLYIKPETLSTFLLGVSELGVNVLGLEQMNRVVSRT